MSGGQIGLVYTETMCHFCAVKTSYESGGGGTNESLWRSCNSQPNSLTSLKGVYLMIWNNFHMKSMYKQNIPASLSNKTERLLNKLILQLSVIFIRSLYIFAGWGLREVMSKHMKNDLSSWFYSSLKFYFVIFFNIIWSPSDFSR